MPEKRIVLKNCYVIDPGNINTYLEQDGFKALTLALGMAPEAVIVSESIRLGAEVGQALY
jgi:NADH:ubiquinone oxidoreductase subunit F (NADH-binding)